MLFNTPVFSHLPGPPKRGAIGRKVAKTPVPDFTLVDQEGKDFRFGNLRGKVVLVTFGFTSCPDICPILTAKLAQIQRKLKAEKNNGIFLLSITTDPEIDKPAVLKAYGDRYGLDVNSWAFLTGSKNELAKVWDIFGVKAKKISKGLIQHTGLTVLIDRKGMRRINYFGDKWQETEVLEDINALVREK